MNIYLVSQDENKDYDTFDAMVVVAENEEEARNIHPRESYITFNENAHTPAEAKAKFLEDWEYGKDSWVDSPSKVTVQHLGKANTGCNKGIILASFNAG
jgi:hypothetical protein